MHNIQTHALQKSAYKNQHYNNQTTLSVTALALQFLRLVLRVHPHGCLCASGSPLEQQKISPCEVSFSPCFSLRIAITYGSYVPPMGLTILPNLNLHKIK